jgi:hypothetical protein
VNAERLPASLKAFTVNIEQLDDVRISVIGVDLKPYFLLALRHHNG